MLKNCLKHSKKSKKFQSLQVNSKQDTQPKQRKKGDCSKVPSKNTKNRSKNLKSKSLKMWWKIHIKKHSFLLEHWSKSINKGASRIFYLGANRLKSWKMPKKHDFKRLLSTFLSGFSQNRYDTLSFLWFQPANFFHKRSKKEQKHHLWKK